MVIPACHLPIIARFTDWFVTKTNEMRTAFFNTHFWQHFLSICWRRWATLSWMKTVTTACNSSALWFYVICNCCSSIRTRFSICWNINATIQRKQYQLALDCIRNWLCSIIHAIQVLSGNLEVILNANSSLSFRFVVNVLNRRYFKKTTVCVHTIRNVPPGDRIAENYGPLYSQNAKTERLETLKKSYWFDCTCEACDQNWPLYADMNTNEIRFK